MLRAFHPDIQDTPGPRSPGGGETFSVGAQESCSSRPELELPDTCLRAWTPGAAVQTEAGYSPGGGAAVHHRPGPPDGPLFGRPDTDALPSGDLGMKPGRRDCPAGEEGELGF